jgi:hypothetical protein
LLEGIAEDCLSFMLPLLSHAVTDEEVIIEVVRFAYGLGEGRVVEMGVKNLAPIYTKLRTSGYIDETGDQVAEMLRIIGVESLVQFVNIDLFKQINCLMVAMNIWFELCIQLEWCLRWKLEGGM